MWYSLNTLKKIVHIVHNQSSYSAAGQLPLSTINPQSIHKRRQIVHKTTIENNC